MIEFQTGDRVVVNGSLIATIVRFAPEANLVVVERPVGKTGTETLTLHLSNTSLELLDGSEPAANADSEILEPATADESGDEFTTLGSI